MVRLKEEAEIPTEVRYEELFIGPLTIRQSIYAGIAAALGVLVWYTIAGFLKYLILLGILVAAMGFMFLGWDKLLLDIIAYTAKGERRASWLSTAARDLLGVMDIRADAVFLRDGRVLGVIKVTPVSFGMLAKDQQDALIYGFLQFLHAISFPIQIVMRSVNLDLENYLNALHRRILERDDKIALAYFDHFSSYLRDYIRSTQITNRLFYIVVPAQRHWSEREVLRNLDARCRTVIESLALAGIEARRLETRELIELYSSYFTEVFWVDEEFVSPITVYKRFWKKAPELLVPPAE